jgi:hypothetical protein
MNLTYFRRDSHEVDVNGARRRRAILGSAMLAAMLGGNGPAGAPPAGCDMQLTVELTPDVPNASDVGFLSSLLNNQVGYRLYLLQQRSGSVVVLELTGSESGCEDVVEVLRKDGRVLSVHMHQELS